MGLLCYLNSIKFIDMFILQLDSIDNVMREGCYSLKTAYAKECSEDDHMALRLIHELRGCMRREYCIEGFNDVEIESLLEYICMQLLSRYIYIYCVNCHMVNRYKLNYDFSINLCPMINFFLIIFFFFFLLMLCVV
jgi:hypothetical protein